MTKEEERFKYLLSKWLYENLSPQEIDEFLQLLHSPVSDKILDKSIVLDLQKRHQKLLETAEIEPLDIDADREDAAEPFTSKVSFMKRAGKWMAAASVILLILCVAVWNKKKDHANILVENVIKEKDWKSFANNTKGIVQYILPDSSIVSLKPNAEISFVEDFVRDRNVKLVKGNAFFEVRKNPSYPFSVLAKGIKTTALGTAFWVENPILDSTITVKLKRGKVRIVSVEQVFHMKNVFLEPGQDCYINKETGYVNVNMKKTKTLASANSDNSLPINNQNNKAVLWTNDKIVFNGASLSSVLLQLEGKYDVKIIADKKVTEKIVLTGQIYANDSLNIILKSICDMNDLQYEIRNDSVFMKKK